MSQHEDHRDDTALAGEYVLHLLDEQERAAFESRLSVEPALRVLVREWEEQFVTLADDIVPVSPPGRVKSRLQGALFPPKAGRKRLVWGWLSGGVVAAGIAIGAVLLMPTLLQDIASIPSLTASVVAEDGSLVVVASFSSETNTLELVREAGGAQPGRMLELWLIAEGADAPVSLGLLSDEAETLLELPPSVAQQLANGVLAISDEPPGGSPTGAPTGDVLAVGPVTEA